MLYKTKTQYKQLNLDIMKDYQKAEVKMMQAVVDFFDNNPELEEKNPILKTHVNPLREKLKEIAENEKKQNYVNTGYTKNKKLAKEELAHLDVNITSSICSFANDTGKNELYDEFNVSISKVKIMSDADIVSYSNTIVEQATEYAKELKPYNVTADELVNLTAQCKAYSKILLIPAEERKIKSVAVANIKKLIPEGLKILSRSVDFDMVHYKDTQPDLYHTYENMREIDDSATHALSIIGTVIGHETDIEVLSHVRVGVKFRAGTALKEMKTVTSAKGNYQFKGIPDGKCKLTFELEYYDTVVKEIAVYSDKATKLDVEMTKTVNN